jgi:EAL domain-containing protein (putative c-di-GMP-specific phosphodiesterase class I)
VNVVAEGVETESERNTLVGLGVDLMQGFLFARPAPMPEQPSPPTEVVEHDPTIAA